MLGRVIPGCTFHPRARRLCDLQRITQPLWASQKHRTLLTVLFREVEELTQGKLLAQLLFFPKGERMKT